MNNQKLVKYVKEQQKKGFSIEKIRKALIKYGIEKKRVEVILSKVQEKPKGKTKVLPKPVIKEKHPIYKSSHRIMDLLVESERFVYVVLPILAIVFLYSALDVILNYSGLTARDITVHTYTIIAITGLISAALYFSKRVRNLNPSIDFKQSLSFLMTPFLILYLISLSISLIYIFIFSLIFLAGIVIFIFRYIQVERNAVIKLCIYSYLVMISSIIIILVILAFIIALRGVI